MKKKQNTKRKKLRARHAKAVVTGGAGFIGSHIVDALVSRGFEVHVVDNYAGGKRKDRINEGAIYHDMDVRDDGALLSVMRGASYVFHEAALPRVQYSVEHPTETFSVNVGGTVSALNAAHKAGVERFVYAASSSVYGDHDVPLLHEDLPARPQSPYGLQKYKGELACRMWHEVYGLPTVSLRYFNVYGPRLDPNGAYALVIGKFLKQRAAGKPLTIWGKGTHTRDFTHVRDIVTANMLAMDSKKVGSGEVINIGAGRDISVKELASMIGGAVVHEKERREPAFTKADIRLAKKLLGWVPSVSFEDGIKELKKMFNVDL
ncbi:MAG TPA: NAD-dependent epimerase/dehydratase family protein [Candidatus Paceibacterota bacterium]